jgi:hypothetical protein
MVAEPPAYIHFRTSLDVSHTIAVRKLYEFNVKRLEASRSLESRGVCLVCHDLDFDPPLEPGAGVCLFTLKRLRESALSTSHCLTCLVLWGAIVACVGSDAESPLLLSTWVFIYGKEALDEGPLRLMILFVEDENEFNKRIKLQLYRTSGK